jgi:hypothetical protein
LRRQSRYDERDQRTDLITPFGGRAVMGRKARGEGVVKVKNDGLQAAGQASSEGGWGHGVEQARIRLACGRAQGRWRYGPAPGSESGSGQGLGLAARRLRAAIDGV